MGHKYSVVVNLDGERADGTPGVTTAGSQLRGTIVLTVHQKMKPGMIDITLTGTETTSIPRVGRHGRQENAVIEGRISIPTNSNATQIYHSRGTYSYPFSFELPCSLPSSFEFPSKGRSYNAKIEYKISVSMGKHSLTKIVPVISAPLPNAPVPSTIGPTTFKLKSYGVINKGCVSLGASVANSLVGRGESLVVSIVSKSNTSARIERVRVRLVEIIECRATNEQSSHQQTHEITLQKYKDVSLPNIDRQRKSWREARRSSSSFDESTTHREIEHELSSEENRLLLKVPEWARDSFGGSLVVISHKIEVTFLTKTALTENPTVSIPVCVGTPPLVSSGLTPSRTFSATSSTISNGENLTQGTATPSAPPESELPINVDHPNIYISECEQIPWVDAVVVGHDDNSDSSDDVTPQPSAPNESFDFRNHSVFLNRQMDIEPNMSSDSLSLGRDTLPSMRRLLYELDGSSNAPEVITSMLTNQDWCNFFEELSPREVGRIILRIHASQQISVALLLFSSNKLSCVHCAAAIKHTTENVRLDMAKSLLPFCMDIRTNYECVSDVLDIWEVQQLERPLHDAILARGS